MMSRLWKRFPEYFFVMWWCDVLLMYWSPFMLKDLYCETWVSVEVESLFKPNVKKYVNEWICILACAVKETFCACGIKRAVEIVKAFLIQEMWDEKLNMHGKWACVGMSLVWRWCQNEVCMYVDVFGVKCCRCWRVWNLTGSRVICRYMVLFLIVWGPSHSWSQSDHEGQGVCPPMCIWWSRNTCNIQMRRFWVYMLWTHKEQDFVVRFVTRLVWICFNVQDQNATYKFYEEGPMGGNQTVCNFWMKKNFYVGE